MAAAMASSEDPRGWGASPKIMDLEPDLDTSSGGKLAHREKAIPTAHRTFLINCATGKQLSLSAPLVPRQAPSPRLGPVTPAMKTYILFCEDSQPHLTQEATLDGEHFAQAKGTLPPCRETVAPASSPVSPLCPQEAPEAKDTSLKLVPARSLAWGTVMDSLKAFTSCVCGQKD